MARTDTRGAVPLGLKAEAGAQEPTQSVSAMLEQTARDSRGAEQRLLAVRQQDRLKLLATAAQTGAVALVSC